MLKISGNLRFMLCEELSARTFDWCSFNTPHRRVSEMLLFKSFFRARRIKETGRKVNLLNEIR